MKPYILKKVVFLTLVTILAFDEIEMRYSYEMTKKEIKFIGKKVPFSIF